MKKLEGHYGLIYKITNLINNKIYIGQTTFELENYKIYTKRNLKYKRYANRDLYKAMVKYGFHNFKWEILEYCESYEKLNEAEIGYIYFYRSYGSDRINRDNAYGYNMTTGGEGKKFKKYETRGVNTQSKTIKLENIPNNLDYIQFCLKQISVFFEKRKQRIYKFKKIKIKLSSSRRPMSIKNKGRKGKRRLEQFKEKYGEKEGVKKYKEYINGIKAKLDKRKWTEEEKIKFKKVRTGATTKPHKPHIHSTESLNKMKELGKLRTKENGAKSIYEWWLEKYGKEEADKKMLELKEKQSIIQKELYLNGRVHPMLGTKLTPEHLEAMLSPLRNKKQSSEQIAKRVKSSKITRELKKLQQAS